MSFTHLTYHQRYQIDRGLKLGQRISVIACRIGVHRSTVYREIARGRNLACTYLAAGADESARARGRCSAANHPTKPASLWRRVAHWIGRDFSPDEVAGRLERLSAHRCVSVPAIYAYIRRDEYSCGSLHEHLRRAPRRWVSRPTTGGLPKNRPSIRQRPHDVHARLALGHWEADTMLGNHSHPARVLVAVERKSRFAKLARLPSGKALPTGSALAGGLERFKVSSITFDNGVEFADYARVCQKLGCQAYFAQPYRAWQRGTCENTVGLMRQYLPKHRSLRKLTDAQLRHIEHRLNHRPRKCLGYLTPHEVLFNKTPVAIRT